MMKRPFVRLLLVLGAFSLGIGVAQWYLAPSSDSAKAAQVPALVEEDFTLTQKEQQVKLADFRGKLVLVYFGYTSCPDVCPTSLSLLGAALKQLNAEEVVQIQPIFISVDPERDQGEKLMTYARYFHPSFLGLTGTTLEIQRAAAQYGAFYSKVNSNSALGYLVDHTSDAYLIGRDGKLQQTLTHQMQPATIVEHLRRALNAS